MRTFAFIVFLLFCGYSLVARWYFVCQVRQLCTEVQEDVRLQTLSLKEGDKMILEGYDQFAFAPDSIQPRLNADNHNFLDTLATILEADSSKSLSITAFFRESEKDLQPGFFENIGLARADALRKLLVERGIAENRISLDHGISEDLDLQEPVLFELYPTSGIPDEFDKVQFSFTNMTFSDANFEFDKADFRPTPPCVLYADSVKTYLDLNPGKTLTIIGHTDSKGLPKYNKDLGIRRAKSAMEYFRELGVTTEIKVDSKGETEPVAPNQIKGKDNPSGRQKNRRVNFVIQ
ncbi:MAG: hypothetical protein DHS20C18_32090 [Saprospiraceae bacterium]|nr:MAG: hypothetical protein DHS20C18_32090 [Saprospiraceae bacterium]